MPPRLDPTPAPATPELDRRSEVMHSTRHPHEVLTEFYDWLREQGLRLCAYETRKTDEPCPGFGLVDLHKDCRDGRVFIGDRDMGERHARCRGTGWVKIEREDWWEDHRTPERLFLDFFGLDQDKIDTEQRELLNSLRTRPQS
jgi:hypothetical protein